MKLSNVFLVFALLFAAVTAEAQKSSDALPGSDLNVFIPNAFTPNSDGHNDYFVPVIDGPQIEFYEFTVLDRTGHEVFYSTVPGEVWNGTVKGSSYISSPNIFIYFLKLKTVRDRSVKIYRGHVAMIR